MWANDFEFGDLVWAKMKNFPPWPGQIVVPPTDAKPRKGSHYVFFLGSKNYAWMKDEAIRHHAEHLIPPSSKKKTALFQSAIDEIIELSKDKPFKVGRFVESTDGVLFDVSPETKSPEQNKLKDSKRKSKDKISRKRLSPNILDKNNGSPKMRRFDQVNSSRDLDDSSSLVSSSSSYGFDDDNGIMAPRHVETSDDSDIEVADSSRNYVLPTSKKIGFLGLGTMGHNIARHLLHSGHDVTVWNRTPGKCLDLIKAGAVSSETPAEVVRASDIIFSCVSDAAAVKSLIFGHNGVLKGLEDSINSAGRENFYKGYVEMTSMDFETSTEIAEAIEVKGGIYLHAAIIGSKEYAEEGNLLILASGSSELFNDCKTCFDAISSRAYYLSAKVGQSLKYGIIISAFMGTTLAAMSETLTLAERAKVPPFDFLRLLNLKGFSCPHILERAKTIIEHKFGHPSIALKHQQKDIELATMMSSLLEQSTPVTTSANELYKRARLLGYGDHDATTVYYGTKY